MRENTCDLSAVGGKMADSAMELAQLTEKMGNDLSTEYLHQVAPLLRQGMVRIALLGATSSGKSTVANALMGELTLPENSLTSSPIPVWIGYADQDAPTIRILRQGETDAEQIPVEQFQKEYCFNANDILNRDRERFNSVSQGMISCRSDLLKTGAVLVDTLGISATEADTAKTYTTLEKGMDLVLFVTKNAELNQPEIQFLQDCVLGCHPQTRMVSHPVAPENILFVHNNFGRVPPHREAFEKGVRTVFEPCGLTQEQLDGILQNNIFYTNARKARLGRIGVYPYVALAPNGCIEEELFAAEKSEKREQTLLDHSSRETLYAQSGFEALTRGLLQKIESVSFGPSSVVLHRIGELTEILNQVQQAADSGVTAINMDAAKLEMRRNDLNRHRQDQQTAQQAQEAAILRQKNDFIGSFNRLSKDQYPQIHSEIENKLAMMPAPADFDLRYRAFNRMTMDEKKEWIVGLLTKCGYADNVIATCQNKVYEAIHQRNENERTPYYYIEQSRKYIAAMAEDLRLLKENLAQEGADLGVSLPTEASIQSLSESLCERLEENLKSTINDSLSLTASRFSKNIDRYVARIRWNFLVNWLPISPRAFWNRVNEQVFVPLTTELLASYGSLTDNAAGGATRIYEAANEAYQDMDKKLFYFRSKMLDAVELRIQALEEGLEDKQAAQKTAEAQRQEVTQACQRIQAQLSAQHSALVNPS